MYLHSVLDTAPQHQSVCFSWTEAPVASCICIEEPPICDPRNATLIRGGLAEKRKKGSDGSVCPLRHHTW